MSGRNYRKIDGCWSCDYMHFIHDHDEDARYYCTVYSKFPEELRVICEKTTFLDELCDPCIHEIDDDNL